MTGYLRGGLGNQMFIAATTLAQSARHGVPFELDDSFLARNSAHVGDLGAFDHRARVVRRAPRWVAAEPTSRPARVARPLGILSSVFTERSYAYDPRIERTSPGTLLNGYFQSWRYFDSIASEVRTRFWTLLEPSSWFVTTEQELASLGPWVGVHVRQGDYLRPKVARNHGLVAGAYLDRALNLVRQLGHDGRLVLFSDDPARAVALHPELRAAHRVQPPEGSHPAESMLLLAGAPALITANSSFSWWAGYLGDRPGRPVVCPRPWFGALAGDTRDLLLPHWTTVDRRDLGWAAAATGVRAAAGRPD